MDKKALTNHYLSKVTSHIILLRVDTNHDILDKNDMVRISMKINAIHDLLDELQSIIDHDLIEDK
jgi:hypothetical protein